jgi:thiamine biosynthesis lipoprotein
VSYAHPTASFPALGTTAVVAVTDPGALADARAILAAHLDAVDLACSRFRPDSELALLNAGALTDVSKLLFRSVCVALGAAAATGGLVDPTLGANLRAAGYDRTFALVRARDGWQISHCVRDSSWIDVRLDDERRAVGLPRGLELDLGATAKALAADDAARAIAEATDGGALVCLGGDLAVHGDIPPGGWPVLIADDHAAPLGGDGPVVSISSGGLATSGTAVRRWRTDEGEAHHILDPRTGAPARTSWRTVTVAAESCVDANTAATAAVVLGDRALEWLDERRLPARLVRNDGAVFTAAGWPEEARAA